MTGFRRLVVTLAAVGAAAPASAGAQPVIATSVAVEPAVARTGQDVAITLTATNTGTAATAYPLFLRSGAVEGDFGVTSFVCPAGAVQTNISECRLDAPFAPGATATLRLTGASPTAGTFDVAMTAYAVDDADHADDTATARVVVQGPTNDGSGVLGDGPAPGSPPATRALDLPRPVLATRRVRQGRAVAATLTLDRRLELVATLERRTGRRWTRVRGVGPRFTRPAGRATVRLGAKLPPGRYRLTLIGVTPQGERDAAPPVTFDVVKRR